MSPIRISLAAAIVFGAILIPATAQPADGLIMHGEIEQFAALMTEEGYRAKISETDTGKIIISGAEGLTFSVSLSYCDEDNVSNCEVVTFASAFIERKVSIEKLNDWNRQAYFTAYQDEDGDANLDFHINLKGGISDANFMDSLAWYAGALSSFEEFIDEDTGEEGQ